MIDEQSNGFPFELPNAALLSVETRDSPDFLQFSRTMELLPLSEFSGVGLWHDS
jgi:hypothetical protein